MPWLVCLPIHWGFERWLSFSFCLFQVCFYTLFSKFLSIFCPMENQKRYRRFIALIILKMVFILFVIIHLGHFIDIPFVPKMLVLRLPSFVFFTAIYVYIVLICLNQMKVIPHLNNMSIKQVKLER